MRKKCDAGGRASRFMTVGVECKPKVNRYLLFKRSPGIPIKCHSKIAGQMAKLVLR